MNNILGKLQCAIVRLFDGTHKWRRLRRSETSYIPASEGPVIAPAHYRLCSRCLTVRSVKQRKKGEA